MEGKRLDLGHYFLLMQILIIFSLIWERGNRLCDPLITTQFWDEKIALHLRACSHCSIEGNLVFGVVFFWGSLRWIVEQKEKGKRTLWCPSHDLILRWLVCGSIAPFWVMVQLRGTRRFCVFSFDVDWTRSRIDSRRGNKSHDAHITSSFWDRALVALLQSWCNWGESLSELFWVWKEENQFVTRSLITLSFWDDWFALRLRISSHGSIEEGLYQICHQFKKRKSLLWPAYHVLILRWSNCALVAHF